MISILSKRLFRHVPLLCENHMMTTSCRSFPVGDGARLAVQRMGVPFENLDHATAPTQLKNVDTPHTAERMGSQEGSHGAYRSTYEQCPQSGVPHDCFLRRPGDCPECAAYE